MKNLRKLWAYWIWDSPYEAKNGIQIWQVIPYPGSQGMKSCDKQADDDICVRCLFDSTEISEPPGTTYWYKSSDFDRVGAWHPILKKDIPFLLINKVM